MIDSTSSSDRTLRASSVGPDVPQNPTNRRGPGRDSLTTQSAGQLNAALSGQPELRPAVVARGRTLAADPSYPSAEVITHVASAILSAPDLSDDQE